MKKQLLFTALTLLTFCACQNSMTTPDNQLDTGTETSTDTTDKTDQSAITDATEATDNSANTDNDQTDSDQTDSREETDVQPTADNPYPRLEADIYPQKPDYGVIDDYCSSTTTCKLSAAECGYINDGCNKVLTCGGCKTGQSCLNNQCGYGCDNTTCPTDQYCQNNLFGALCRCQPGYYKDSAGHCQLQTTATITLMAANITSGAHQTYCGPGIRIFKALKPDIAMVQEFDYSDEDDLEYGYSGSNELVYRAFGPEYTATVGRGNIPNAIISRYPILESGNWDDGNGDRDYQWAIIDIPGDTDLLAVSLHIKAGKSNSDKSERNSQIQKLLTAIEEKLASSTASYYLAIGGDFNLTARTEYAFNLLEKYFSITGPYPADQNGNDYSNTNRDHPYDGVFVSPGLDALEVPVIIGSSTYENGLLFDSRVYTPLEEVAPVLVTDCEPQDENGDATNMQHMAIMKKYRLW